MQPSGKERSQPPDVQPLPCRQSLDSLRMIAAALRALFVRQPLSVAELGASRTAALSCAGCRCTVQLRGLSPL